MQPAACPLKNSLTVRSSSEWKRDRRQAAAGFEHPVGLFEAASQRLELVVDHDAQRLEHAARRVAGGEPGRRGDGALDDVDELPGGLEGLLGALPFDAPRDVVRVALLAVAAEDVGELADRQHVDEVGGGDGLRRVHAHVERRVPGIREAALATVELHRRDAEVHVDDVDRGVGALGEHVGEVAVVELGGARRLAGDVAEVLGDRGVAVAGDQQAVGAEAPRPRRQRDRRRRTWRRRRSRRPRA